jgi:hypothetical protein
MRKPNRKVLRGIYHCIPLLRVNLESGSGDLFGGIEDGEMEKTAEEIEAAIEWLSTIVEERSEP